MLVERAVDIGTLWLWVVGIRVFLCETCADVCVRATGGRPASQWR